MSTVVPRGNPDGPRLEVADDAVDRWLEVGYVLADGQRSASTAKKTAAKKASSSKSSK